MPATPPAPSPAATYESRRDRFLAERADLDARSATLSRLRMALALLVATGLVWIGYGGGAVATGLAGASAVVLAVVALRHARVDDACRRAAGMAEINADALARLRRDWSAVRDWLTPPTIEGGHACAGDLDVSGHASVLRLLGRARTRPGDRRLTDWLLTPAAPAGLPVRQRAVAGLASLLDDRQQLAFDALATHGMNESEIDRFLQWCEAGPWLRRRTWLYAVFVALGAVGVASLALNAIGWSQSWWAGSVTIGLALSVLVQRRLSRCLEDASWQAALRGWRAVFDTVLRLRARVPDLQALGGEDRLDDDACAALDALDRTLGFASLRHTPLLHWPIHLVTMWDAHVWWALEGWQQRHGTRVRGWLDAAATAEAVAALAGLAADHPDWVFPSVDEAATALVASDVGHPLIAPGKCVGNDVTLGPAGTTMLVTGSNMSGKSTLLRAIGVNAVLAQAGGPVRAASWRMPTVSIVTSMRLADSLEDGVSFFMASLARLKLVVDAASAATRRPGAPHVLYLLDELLSGTNTAERAVAVRAVIAHLLRCRAIGAVTTHDLALADAPEVRTHATLVHFRETVERRDGHVRMDFDYRLRPGVAQSTNAIALMEVVGLGGIVTPPTP